jgi:hypothetical protein
MRVDGGTPSLRPSCRHFESAAKIGDLFSAGQIAGDLHSIDGPAAVTLIFEC